MRKLLFLFIVGCIISLSSCREDFKFEANTGGLEFSKDTVYLDTIFTNIGSSTYRLKVYNRSDNDISIPKIQLQKGVNSKYRIMVDGLTGDAGAQGKIFSNVELLAKDSLFIFIEVTADVASANPTDFLYTDKIEFTNISGQPQDVDLVTLIQDAYFIYPQRSDATGEFLYEAINLGVDDANEPVIAVGSNLDQNDPVNGNEYSWNNSKPYVVYGYAFVPDGKTLTVEAGARIHFHANSGLIVDKNAVLKVEGQLSDYDTDGNVTVDRAVHFEGDRLEPIYENVPGQWGTIMMLSTSNQNSIDHLIIKNATVGILVQNIATATSAETPFLSITNSQIYDCSNIGILARNANITGNNLVINNAGQATLACTYGGSYNFTHCTFNNTWPSSNQVGVLINNYLETTDTIYINDLDVANFTNCIVYGSNQIEMLLDKNENTPSDSLFNYKFKNCLIKFNNINNRFTNDPLYQFSAPDLTFYESCSIATNPSLFNPQFEDEGENKLWLTEHLNIPADESFIGTTDILGVFRNLPLDIGAYQFTE